MSVALIELWTMKPQLPYTSSVTNFPPRPQSHQKPSSVFSNEVLQQLQLTPDGLSKFLTLSTSLPLNKKRRILFFCNVLWLVNYR